MNTTNFKVHSNLFWLVDLPLLGADRITSTLDNQVLLDLPI